MVGSPAGWHRDPYGRHEQRYFDGTNWTQHVFDHGVQGVDAPVVSAPPIAPPMDVPGPGFGTVPVPTPAYPPPRPAWDSVIRPRFRSIHGLAVALTWMLGAAILATLAMAGALVNRRAMLERARDGDFATLSEARTADDYVDAAVALGFVLGLAIFVVLIVFLFRASKNTGLWERRPPRWAPGWTIGGWFIPCASYVIPVLVVRDIWQRTPESAAGGARPPATALVWCWWVAWAVGNLGYLAGRDREGIAALSRSDALRAAGSVTLAAASVLLVLVVRALDRRQMQLRQGLLPDPSTSYPPPSGEPWTPDSPPAGDPHQAL